MPLQWRSLVVPTLTKGFSDGSAVKNPLAVHEMQERDPGLIPGSGRSPGGGMATQCSILARKIPWTAEPGGLQSMG